MAVPQWKRFQFFDKELVREEGQANTPHSALQKLPIASATSGRGFLVIADRDGYVNLVDRDWKITAFQAYEVTTTRVLQLKQRNIVITVGEDKEGIDPTIKIWNLDRRETATGQPTLVHALKITKTQVFPVTALAAMEDLSQLAVGLASGTVVLFRALGAKRPKEKLLQQQAAAAAKQPVTGLGFREGRAPHLFVVTSTTVHCYDISAPKAITGVLLDPHGCDLDCAVLSDDQNMVVARKDAVYFYETDGRGPCLAFDGDKKMVAWFRSYLLVVSVDARNKFATLNIYDIKNKLIAYSGSFENVFQIVAEWGSIFVVTQDNKFYQLEEKDTQSKLETLFKRNLYSVAISLAHSQQYDYNSIIDIFRKYGDHLYNKGDFDGAITQYLRTIGRLEPSYVIRKFLDAQRIHNLTSYLQALHEKGLANADHTTLLLNCYTKLEDTDKLNEFIKTDSEMNFDVQTAIKVCRQAGYFGHALYLAKRHGEHEFYLKILLEDTKDYETALDYIQRLDVLEAEKNLKTYGKALVTALPDQTTKVLMRLCTAYTPLPPLAGAGPLPSASATTTTTTSATAPAPHHSALTALTTAEAAFKSATTKLVGTAITAPTQTIASSVGGVSAAAPASGGGPATATTATTTTTASTTSSLATGAATTTTAAAPAAAATAPGSKTQKLFRAEAEEFIHIYVDRPDWLQTFLEYIVVRENLGSTLVLNTLLELYLREEPSAGVSAADLDATRAARHDKAFALLASGPKKDGTPKVDFDSALVLCQMNRFRRGILYLYDQLNLYNEILQYHMGNNEYKEVVAACKKYGDKEPHLWVQALSFFAGKNAADCQSEIMQVLSSIDRDNLLPPLLVIQILAQKSTATLEVVRDYIVKKLQQQQQQITEDNRVIRGYEEETDKMRTEIEELRTSARIFQLLKCTFCGSPLDLPAVHFLCMHSFHQRCLGENERECPMCAQENRQVLELRRRQEEAASQHEQFFKQLESARDGFQTVADYFGRGIFPSRLGMMGGGGGSSSSTTSAPPAAAPLNPPPSAGGGSGGGASAGSGGGARGADRPSSVRR